MERKNQHYYTPSPDVKIKIHTVAESLRRHLYIFKTVSGVFSFKKIDLGKLEREFLSLIHHPHSLSGIMYFLTSPNKPQ